MKETLQIKLCPPKGTKYLEDLIKRFQSVGFTFEEDVSTTCYEANLPEDWGIFFNGGPDFIICDNKGRERGWLSQEFEKGIPHKIGLYTRYKISSIKRTNGQQFIVIFDRAENKIKYQIGEYSNIHEEFNLVERALYYLNVHYPKWENFDAYWD